MSKYIDVEAFREEMDNHFPFDKYTQDHEPLLDLAKSRIIRLLAKFPSADVEPVKHGRWLDRTQEPGWPVAECSVCGSHAGMFWMNYCPNCGARMNDEEE